MNSRKIILSAAAVAIVLFVLITQTKLFYSAAQTSANAPTEGDQNQPAEDQAHKHKTIVQLKEAAIKEFGIETAQAQSGKIGAKTTLPAEISVNEDRKAHIVPRVPGVVQLVKKNMGDKVKAGDVMAVIHSRELADFKAAFLGAKEKLNLIQTIYEREKKLWEEKITAEMDYLTAKRELADAQIALLAAEQKLHALGFSEEYLKELPKHPDASFIVYEIIAPIDSTIIGKHITLGEVLRDDSECFVIADLSDVWVNVNVHQKDLPLVKAGLKALIKTEQNQGEGTVSYISSIVDDKTRTALARIILPNPDGRWRPGTFATAAIFAEETDCEIVVPTNSIVTIDGKSCIFIKIPNGFEPRAVTTGRSNEQLCEITSGLQKGELYVMKGAFTLKSELMKPTGEE